MSMTAVPLDRVESPELGGKAVALGAARRAGLPVPDGVALCVATVDAITNGAHAIVETICSQLRGPLAVRSSAVGEDGPSASFAGQHVTRLNVIGAAAAVDAIVAVWQSARSDGALAYRARLGIVGPPRIAVIVQRLVRANVAGVLFTRDPLTGADERVIEAAWGLGESVVAGLVTPDRYRIGRDGRVLSRAAGHKDVMLAPRAGGGVEEHVVEPERVHARTLDERRLAALHVLASRVEQVFGPEGHDLEWAFGGTEHEDEHEDDHEDEHEDELFLLQRRPITTRVR